MHDGKIIDAGMTRSYANITEQLFEFVGSYPNLQEVDLSHVTVHEETKMFKKCIASIIDEERIQMFKIDASNMS